MPWLVVLAAVMVASLGSRKQLWRMGVCLIPIAVCLLLTRSRSGYIAAGVGLVLAWFWCRQRKSRIGWKLPGAAAGAVAVLVVAALFVGRPLLLGAASKSFGYRLQYWQSSLGIIADHPWLGCGPGNFQNAYTQYKLPRAAEEIADPHNFLLEVWATAGTPAALAFLAVLACFAWEERKSKAEGGRRKAEDEVASGQKLLNPQIPKSLNPQTSNPQSLIPNPSPDAWLHVLAGGAAGFLLSLPLGWLGAVPPSAAAVVLGLPLAALAVALLLGWIRHGELPRMLPALGVAVLLIDLLTTGGIGMPSIAGTFWLLLALGLQDGSGEAATDHAHMVPGLSAGAGQQYPQSCTGGQAARGTRLATLLLIAAIVLGAACYRTAYSPVLACQAQLRLSEREPDRMIEHLEAAAAADLLSAEPWRQLAASALGLWRQVPTRERFGLFQQANAKFLQLAPNSASAWQASGDWFMEAASQSNDVGSTFAKDAVAEAVGAYRQAARLYPNSALNSGKVSRGPSLFREPQRISARG